MAKYENTQLEGMVSMSSSGVNLALLVSKAMRAHTTQEGCPWKDGAEEIIITSPEFSALERFMKNQEICQTDGNEK